MRARTGCRGVHPRHRTLWAVPLLALATASACRCGGNSSGSGGGGGGGGGGIAAQLSVLAGVPSGLGSADGTGAAARFRSPGGVAADASGNVYVADTANSTVRVISPAGVVTTLAGAAGREGAVDGTGASARFSSPSSVAVDGSGNVYVADTFNSTIRKITPAGAVTTFAGAAGQRGSADGAGPSARFYYPFGIAMDGTGNVYVADTGNATVRMITAAGAVTTLAGTAGQPGSADGTGPAARFASPCGVAVDGGGTVYVADTVNGTIRVITPGGAVTTLAGTPGERGSADGTGPAAAFAFPMGVTPDGSGGVYVADTGNSTIRHVSAGGVVATIAGTAGQRGGADGAGGEAAFRSPSAVAIDPSGDVLVADTQNDTVRRVTPAGSVSTLAGTAGECGCADGTGAAARFTWPTGAAVDPSGNVLVADSYNHAIRRITPSGVVTTVAGAVGQSGSADGTGAGARFYRPGALAVDAAGNVLVADTGNHTLRKIGPDGAVTTIAGAPGQSGSVDGKGRAARFHAPAGVAVDAAGIVYVADTENDTVRRIAPDGVVTTLAGSAAQSGTADGLAVSARFNHPCGLALDASGSLYVADTYNHLVRQIRPTGVVVTLAGSAGQSGSSNGTGAAARFHRPSGLAVGASGDLYVADAGNSTIRRITPQGEVTTLALRPSSGTGTLPGGLAWPTSVAVGPAGNLFIVVPDAVLEARF